MEEQNYEYHFGSEEPIILGQPGAPRPPRRKRSVSVETMLGVCALLVVFTILITAVFTGAVWRAHFQKELMRLEESQNCELDIQRLEILASLFEKYSYYYNEADNEARIEAVLKAYAATTGDKYAAYYTEEEYASLQADNSGSHVGIGIGVLNTTVQVNGVTVKALLVTDVYRNGPAGESGVLRGDYIYAYMENGVPQTVEAVGYTQALSAMRGEIGSEATLLIYRSTGGTYDPLSFSMLRRTYIAESVTSYRSKTNPEVAVLRISKFDMQTPVNLKAEIEAHRAEGIEKFVFDVRNNPGGDLQSVKAVLSFFLQKNDLIISTIDRDGNVKTSYYSEKMTHNGSYANCTVTDKEIGMYAGLSMVVLCNASTASAAEVFTATLRDYGLATVVGEKTFGKGIMQTFYDLSVFPGGEGFAKLTSYAYVTKCGVSYHDIGIMPAVAVAQSGEAMQYYYTLLPETLDDQLQAAVAQLG